MTHESRTSALDRRSFVKSASTLAAGAGAYFSLGGLADAFAPGRDATATESTWPPLSSTGAFEILVFGDSIMWGQGLSDDPAKNQKFRFKVQRWIEQRMPGTEVHTHLFAHSGARILNDDIEDAKPPLHGEVPALFPSVTAQMSAAVNYAPPQHSPWDRQSVALILLDGGITDVGTMKIVTPDPTILKNPLDPTSGAEWIRRATRAKAVARMKDLLPHVLTNFPNAKVVVTNYYQLVSEESDPVYVWELLRVWDMIGPAVTFSSEWLVRKLAAQCLAFHDESTKGFREAVAEARPLAVTANAARSSGRMPSSLDTRLEDRWVQPSRIALAEVPFGPKNSYGAPDTWLFYANEPDPAASVRKPQCLTVNPLAHPTCLLAPAGHPNFKGSAVYADAVEQALIRLVPEWGTPVKVDPRMPVENQPVAAPRPLRVPGRP
jgi:hypothetical protein